MMGAAGFELCDLWRVKRETGMTGSRGSRVACSDLRPVSARHEWPGTAAEKFAICGGMGWIWAALPDPERL